MCSPCVVLEESMYDTLRTAVGRGVAVHLYMGATSHHALTHHAQRSFVLDHEVNLLVLGADFVARLDELVAGHRHNSHELDLADWPARPWHQKHLDNTARLTSALQ